MQYRKKQAVVEAITFDALVAYGLAHTTNIVRGMPWSFNYNGCSITHENDECYLILVQSGGSAKFVPGDMLVTIGGKLEVWPKAKFDKECEVVPYVIADKEIDGVPVRRLAIGEVVQLGDWAWPNGCVKPHKIDKLTLSYKVGTHHYAHYRAIDAPRKGEPSLPSADSIIGVGRPEPAGGTCILEADDEDEVVIPRATPINGRKIQDDTKPVPPQLKGSLKENLEEIKDALASIYQRLDNLENFVDPT
jgi:hypothetical protein